MAGWCKWLSLVLLTQVLGWVHTARILGIAPFPGKSQYAVMTSLFKGLAARGHQVTVVSGFPLDKPLANYTNIQVPFDMSKFVGDLTTTFATGDGYCFSQMLEVLNGGKEISDNTLQNKEVQNLIKSKKGQFDVVIIEDFANEALAGIAHVLDAHLVYFSSTVGFVWTNDFVGNPSGSSYVPNIFTSYNDRMTFTERFLNALHNIFTMFYYHLVSIPAQDAVMRKHLKGINTLPHLSEINAKTSLVLTNAVPGISYPQPLLPNFIQVGGIHIETPKALPQDLQEFLDNSPEGVIYFSMGGYLQSAEFPLPVRELFLKAFAKLRQKILWKFEVDDMPSKPSNVMVRKWLPQNDILAHPNVKLFITHGGIMSNHEAVYHGVPLIGIPIFGDQRLNLKNNERLGFAIILEMSNITYSSVEWALNEVLFNPRYTENMKTVSRIFRDQPQSPMDKAVYWVEYVVRHNGAPHLRSAAMDLAWYQYLLLDVIAVILLIVVTVIYAVILACRKLFDCKRSKTVSSKKKN